MDTITLNRCIRCNLEWRPDDRSETCPRCRKMHSAPTAVIAGIEVQVEAVVLHGAEMGLHDPRVRRGLESLDMFERCRRHGMISWRICPVCSNERNAPLQ